MACANVGNDGPVDYIKYTVHYYQKLMKFE